MFTEGIFAIGDGLLDIDETRLKGLLVQDDINDIYDVEQTPFARGKFAAVRRAIHKNSGVHFAAKFLKRRRRAQSSDKEIKHEIAVLMLCDGADNIVKLNAVHESRSDTALLLELATGGELQTVLDNEECLSEAQARICMREVLKALQFLHNRSIAHLDLKPQNILLAGEHIEDGLKLCDFGISRVVAEGTNVREIVGTPDYVAPEVLQYEPLSLLTDIWSVGVLAYVLLSGFSPFGGDTKQETFLNISQCALTFPDKLFGGVSAPAIDFMRRALRIKPSDRMTAAGCLEHIWLKDECSIDRQIFSNISETDLVEDESFDDDDDDDDDEDEEDEEVELDELEDEEIDEFSIADINGHKMDSSDTEQTAEETTKLHISNGKLKVNGVGNSNSNSSHKSASTDINSKKSLLSKGKPAVAIYSAANGITKKATAIISVPAAHARATTIPLTVPAANAAQQQMLHVASRRHSSDANKENTYLATKKIAPAAASPAASASANAKNTTATATIMIAPATTMTNTASQQQVVATIALPATASAACGDKHSATNAVCCIFPDAPTTPKVIRKAPTTDTSPTSVKALVKKFQLEGSSSSSSSAGNGSDAPRDSSPAPSPGTIASATAATAATAAAHLKESSLQNQQHVNSNAARSQPRCTSSNGTAVVQRDGSRCNETKTTSNRKSIAPTEVPAAAATVNSQKSAASSPPLKKSNSSSAPPSATVAASSPPANNNHFKTTCVFCLTSGGSGVATATTTVTATSSPASTACRHATTVATTTSASNASAASTAAAAILLSNHKQLQHHHRHHHHHHHHHAAHHAQKSAANNLSLDQGIIC